MNQFKKVFTIVSLGLLLGFYQNCSQVSPKVSAASDPSYKASDVAIATDGDGNIIPVETDSTAGIIDGDKDDSDKDDAAKDYEVVVVEPGKKKSCKDKKGNGDVAANDDDEISTDEDLVKICDMDSKTIHNIIDVAQFKDQDVKLDLIKGKTLIYSSDGEVTLKSLNIVEAVGRTILCGVKVDKLEVKKGRLEVKHSEIKEIGEQKGVIFKDTASILPAGY